MAVAAPSLGEVGPTECDREPIRTPGSVQPHGLLLVLDRETLVVTHAGGATRELLARTPEAVLGSAARQILPVAVAEALPTIAARPATGSLTALRARFSGIATDVLVHTDETAILVEVEPVQGAELSDELVELKGMLARAQLRPGIAAFCQGVAEEVRSITGFDRVMVYQFETDGSGVVVAEACGTEVESFLGLRYPGTDIPTQARELYLRNLIRTIPDATYRPSPVLSLTPGGELDLSDCVLRSVSPVHLEYLRNMGVVASMSISLVVDGRLWGLIACHHMARRFVPYRVRLACELFGQMVSAQLGLRRAAEAMELRLDAMRAQDDLLARLGQEPDLTDGLERCRQQLRGYVPSDGVALWIDGRCTRDGVTPGQAAITKLVGWLNEAVADGVFYTDRLPELCPALRDEAPVASGLMALSVSRRPRDYVLWFRPEVVRTVTWAGSPEKPVDKTGDGMRLTPRRSFAAWQELVRGQACPWTPQEVDAVRSLRTSLVDAVLLRLDQLSREREKARIKQDLLAQELDRRIDDWQRVVSDLETETRRRARAEAELSELLRRTVEMQEAERRNIARELHDSVGQTVTLLRLSLDRLERGTRLDASHAARLAELTELVDNLGNELGRLARDIRPTALDDLGLQPAIGHLVDTLQRQTDVAFVTELGLGDRRLPPAIETALYRVLQESLTNVIRHAAASRVTIRLKRHEDNVRLSVTDNGVGFEPSMLAGARVPGSRLGLIGMRERLALIGGRLDVVSSPGNGTRVEAIVRC